MDNPQVNDWVCAGWSPGRAAWEAAGVEGGALYCVEAPPLLTSPTAPYLLLLWVNMLEGERFGTYVPL